METYNDLKALIELRGVHPEFGDAGQGWGIEQSPHELATFLVRMQELGVQSCLEIGTGYRGGLSRFLANDLHWDVTTVDVQNYGHVFEGVHYVVGKSPAFNRMFDLVFIDGDHHYNAVRADYADYRKHATKVIALHDILGFRDCKGVEKFWNELLLTNFGKAANVATSPDIRTASGIGWIEL